MIFDEESPMDLLMDDDVSQIQSRLMESGIVRRQVLARRMASHGLKAPKETFQSKARRAYLRQSIHRAEISLLPLAAGKMEFILTRPPHARTFPEKGIRTILAVVDRDGHATIRAAVAFAQSQGAQIAFIHVVEPEEMEAGHPWSSPTDRQSAIGRALLARVEGEVPQDLMTFTGLRQGCPADAILEVARAWNVDLIILGTGEGEDFSQRLHDPLFQYALDRAPCPIMLVKADPS
jgi:nucleotide-binding universal stress UspA family protein